MPMAQRVEDEGSVSETGETRRGLRERLAAQVDAEVATALFDVLEREVRASGKGASVGAVVFVKAAADGDVARALRRCGQSFGQAHREWMRVNILVFDEVAVSRGFWSEDGLARKTVNDLVADARSCYAPVETKCGAIKTLLLHFPWHLRDSACPTIADVQASWWLAFDELSPVTGSGRVCCASDAVISLRARVAQVYSRAPAPILPENVCASQVCAARCQALQVAAREEALGARLASPHGFRIIPLAIDFLCAECECLFSEADVDKLDNSMVLEWCRRMGCADHDPGACRFWLRSEKARHCARARVMQCVAEGVAAGESQEDAFQHFQDACRLDAFSTQGCVALMSLLQMAALEPEVFCKGTTALERTLCPRYFGIKRHGSRQEYWSPAVPLVARPCSWLDYSGEPGYCSAELWYCRAWALALRGFGRMSPDMQRRLLGLEYQRDERYCFCPAVRPEEDALTRSWVHVVEAWPGGVPSKRAWIQLCAARPRDAQSLRGMVAAYVKRECVQWNAARGCFMLIGAAAAASRRGGRSGRAAIERAEDRLQDWGLWNRAQWEDALYLPKNASWVGARSIALAGGGVHDAGADAADLANGEEFVCSDEEFACDSRADGGAGGGLAVEQGPGASEEGADGSDLAPEEELYI